MNIVTGHHMALLAVTDLKVMAPVYTEMKNTYKILFGKT